MPAIQIGEEGSIIAEHVFSDDIVRQILEQVTGLERPGIKVPPLDKHVVDQATMDGRVFFCAGEAGCFKNDFFVFEVLDNITNQLIKQASDILFRLFEENGAEQFVGITKQRAMLMIYQGIGALVVGVPDKL